MPRATLTIESPKAALIHGSIAPEIGREIPRTRVRAEMHGEDLLLHIEASDLSALRAALNSYLRWIKIAEEVFDIAGG